MDASTNKALQLAQNLIKAGKQQQALDLLITIVRGDPNNADAWMLLGSTLTDPQKKIDSFNQVLRIDPGNPQAKAELEWLTSPKPSVSPFTMDTPEVFGGEYTPQGLEQDDSEVDSFFAWGAQSNEPAQTESNTRGIFLGDSGVSDDEDFHPLRSMVNTNLQDGPKIGGTQPEEKKKPAKPPRALLILAVVAGLAVIGTLSTIAWLWWDATRVTVAPIQTATPLPTLTPGPILTATPTIPAPTEQPGFKPVFKATACPFTVPLGMRVKCGTVAVPLAHGSTSSQLIELPVALFQSAKADADLIVYLQGGPGQESIHWAVNNLKEFTAPLLENYDVLFFDPRGTGGSKPALICPELNSVFLNSYFQSKDQDAALEQFNAFWTNCKTTFAQEKIDPIYFTTQQSAADVNDIVHAMGYEKVNLLGISYGTRLGLTIMRDYPEIVRSAVLDSVVPMEAKMFNRTAADIDYTLQKMFDDCAANPQCNEAYPDLDKVFNDLLARYGKKPVIVTAYNSTSGFSMDVKVNEVLLLEAVVWGLHSTELVPVIPKAIYDISKGDTTFLSFALGVAGNSYNDLSLGTYFATVCTEQVYASEPQTIDADLNISPVLKSAALLGMFGSSQRVYDMCKEWGTSPHATGDSKPVRTEIPTLILSGQYDPTTPTLLGDMLAADLSASHAFVVPGVGHATVVDNACVQGMVKAFIADPASSPDAGCLKDNTQPFFVPYDGKTPVALSPLTDPAGAVNGMAPMGWKKDEQALTYWRHAYLFDPTQMYFTSYVATETSVLTALQRTFGGKGFESAPRKISAHNASTLNWNIYSSTYRGQPVLVAVAQVTSKKTLAVVLVVSQAERSAYLSGLLLPALDAFVPK